MEGGNDDDHLDIDESCQPRASKKLKKVDNLQDDDRPNYEEIEDKNPFQIPVIMDAVFKLLPSEEVKKFRLVSSTWNQVGTSELTTRPQKPLKFNRIEELDGDHKMGTLFQLHRHHNELFPGDFHRHDQLFSKFSFDISVLKILQFDQFFENFSPKFVELCGHEINHDTREILFTFLTKIAPTVREIKYSYFFDIDCKDEESSEEDYDQKLASTSFPNLKKITNTDSSCYLKDLYFYSIIGPNSPKLLHLEMGSITERSLGSPEYMKEKFELAGLMSKLEILCVIDYEDYADQKLLKVITKFGQNGILQLTKLKIEQVQYQLPQQSKEVYAPLIATQAESLKILEISSFLTPIEILPAPYLVPFPSLKNLSILQIDDFLIFEAYFEPINFNSQFPKLVEFRTCDIKTFLAQKVGPGAGDSVKTVTLYKNPSEGRDEELTYFNKSRFDLDQLYQIFPKMENLEMDLINFYPCFRFRPQLRKVVIHCELEDLYFLYKGLFQDIEKVEIMVHCGNDLIDEKFYKDIICRLVKTKKYEENYDYYSRLRYYQDFLDYISENYTSLHSLTLKFIGYKISDEFKRDFRAILPHCTFLCCSYKSNADED